MSFKMGMSCTFALPIKEGRTMRKMIPQFYEDCVEGDVVEFGSYNVTREEVIEFALKYDPQSFHLDDESAKNSMFGRLAASGWHTCAMSMRMVVDHLKSIDAEPIVGAGINDLKWRKPVYPDDTLRVRIKLGLKKPQPTKPFGFVELNYEILNQHDVVTTSYSIDVLMPNKNK
ncbi:MAG: MaoC family dehydratase [Sphingomonadales bacterium]